MITMNKFLKWYNSLPFEHVIESDVQKHRTKLDLWAAYNQGAEDAVEELTPKHWQKHNRKLIEEIEFLKEELDNTAPHYMYALDRERTLAEETKYLKKSLLKIYACQSEQTQEMWTLINELFDRSDPRNPIPRGNDDA